MENLRPGRWEELVRLGGCEVCREPSGAPVGSLEPPAAKGLRSRLPQSPFHLESSKQGGAKGCVLKFPE